MQQLSDSILFLMWACLFCVCVVGVCVYGGEGLRVFNNILSYGLLHYFYAGKTHPLCTMFLLSVNIFSTIAS